MLKENFRVKFKKQGKRERKEEIKIYKILPAKIYQKILYKL